jgi:hypothetical protein
MPLIALGRRPMQAQPSRDPQHQRQIQTQRILKPTNSHTNPPRRLQRQIETEQPATQRNPIETEQLKTLGDVTNTHMALLNNANTCFNDLL